MHLAAMGDEPGGDPLALLLRNLGALNDLAESSGLKSEEAERLSSVAAPGALPAASDAVTEIAEARQAAEKRVRLQCVVPFLTHHKVNRYSACCLP